MLYQIHIFLTVLSFPLIYSASFIKTPNAEESIQYQGENNKTKEIYLGKFLTNNEMEKTLRHLAKKYSSLCKLVVIGKSGERRPIYMMKISDDFNAKKGVVMLEAGMHAREWLAPSMALHVIYEVLKQPALLQQIEWQVIPVANPDGYYYSHTESRFWRKTRSKSESSICFGTDGNRNFGIHWGEVGGSQNPCEEIYEGKAPFSEAETRAVRDVATAVKDRLKVYLSLHSYGSYIIYPFGNTRELVPDWKDLDDCGNKAAKAITDNGGTNFTVGNTATVLYPSGGGSDDYVRGALGVKYVFTMELPGGGRLGFDYPAEGISEVVQEVFPGVLTLSKCWIN